MPLGAQKIARAFSFLPKAKMKMCLEIWLLTFSLISDVTSVEFQEQLVHYEPYQVFFTTSGIILTIQFFRCFTFNTKRTKRKLKKMRYLLNGKGTFQWAKRPIGTFFICGLWYYLEIKKQTVKNLARFDMW